MYYINRHIILYVYNIAYTLYFFSDFMRVAYIYCPYPMNCFGPIRFKSFPLSCTWSHYRPCSCPFTHVYDNACGLVGANNRVWVPLNVMRLYFSFSLCNPITNNHLCKLSTMGRSQVL